MTTATFTYEDLKDFRVTRCVTGETVARALSIHEMREFLFIHRDQTFHNLKNLDRQDLATMVAEVYHFQLKLPRSVATTQVMTVTIVMTHQTEKAGRSVPTTTTTFSSASTAEKSTQT
jgi:hypothetical protein